MKQLSIYKVILLIILLGAAGICLLLGIEVQKVMCDDVYLLSFRQNNRFFESNTVADIENKGVSLTYVRYLYPEVSNGFRTENATVMATNENYSYFSGMEMKAGAFFNGTQADKKLFVTVLNETAAYQLFGNHECIGERVYLNQIAFEVVGISKDSDDEENAKVFIPDRTAEALNIPGLKVSQLWCRFANTAEAALMINKIGYSMSEMSIWQMDLYKGVFLQRFFVLLTLAGIISVVCNLKAITCRVKKFRQDSITNKKWLVLSTLQLLGLMGTVIFTLKVIQISWYVPPHYDLIGKSGINVFYEILEFYTLSGIEIDNMHFLSRWNLLSLLCFLICQAGIMLSVVTSVKRSKVDSHHTISKQQIMNL